MIDPPLRARTEIARSGGADATPTTVLLPTGRPAQRGRDRRWISQPGVDEAAVTRQRVPAGRSRASGYVSPVGKDHRLAVISLAVIVPVLSVQMTVVEPSVSTD
jgi:hypothetical protein